jgi:multiple sugar transport system substrate-binding protein
MMIACELPRRLVARCLALATALTLAACSSDQASRSPEPSASPPAAARRRIRVLAVESPSLAAFEKTKGRFEAAAGISVDILRRDHAGVLKETRELSGGSQATYDLLIVPSRFIGALVERGYVQPIDGFLNDSSLFDPRLFDPQTDVFPGWWSEVSWYRGHPYGYPFQLRPMSLWYREDLFDDEDESVAFERRYGRPLALPGNPSDLEQVAEFFHRPQEGLYGTVIAARSRSLASEWLAYASMFDARILDAPKADTYGDIVVNSPQAIRATEFSVSLLRFSPPDARTYEEQDAVRAFESRRVAVGIMRHDLALAGPQASGARGGIGYAPAPFRSGASVTPIDGDTFLIPRGTSQAREAFALMQWALSQEAQVALILGGGVAARPSTFTDSRVTALPNTYRSLPFMQIVMFPRIVTEPMKISAPAIVEADQLFDALSRELGRILAGEMTPKAGLDAAAVRMAQILKGKAKRRY